MNESSYPHPTICVDLDGVLNLYDGYKGPEHFAEPRPGAREFLQSLKEGGYTVVVHTTRDRDLVWSWLVDHDLRPFVYGVARYKPPAVAYIDDRAICFMGSFDGLFDRVRSFKAHWE